MSPIVLSEKVDVIVVLGAAIWRGGQPSPALLRRMMHAIALFREGKAEYLLVTGGIGQNPPAEAIVMRDIAVRGGVPTEKILLEDKSSSTMESGRACAQILRRYGWSTVLLVTDRYHLARGLLVFRANGIKTLGSSPKGGHLQAGLLHWIFYYLREAMALPWYLILLELSKVKNWGLWRSRD